MLICLEVVFLLIDMPHWLTLGLNSTTLQDLAPRGYYVGITGRMLTSLFIFQKENLETVFWVFGGHDQLHPAEIVQGCVLLQFREQRQTTSVVSFHIIDPKFLTSEASTSRKWALCPLGLPVCWSHKASALFSAMRLLHCSFHLRSIRWFQELRCAGLERQVGIHLY